MTEGGEFASLFFYAPTTWFIPKISNALKVSASLG